MMLRSEQKLVNWMMDVAPKFWEAGQLLVNAFVVTNATEKAGLPLRQHRRFVWCGKFLMWFMEPQSSQVEASTRQFLSSESDLGRQNKVVMSYSVFPRLWKLLGQEEALTVERWRVLRFLCRRYLYKICISSLICTKTRRQKRIAGMWQCRSNLTNGEGGCTVWMRIRGWRWAALLKAWLWWIWISYVLILGLNSSTLQFSEKERW